MIKIGLKPIFLIVLPVKSIENKNIALLQLYPELFSFCVLPIFLWTQHRLIGIWRRTHPESNFDETEASVSWIAYNQIRAIYINEKISHRSVCRFWTKNKYLKKLHHQQPIAHCSCMILFCMFFFYFSKQSDNAYSPFIDTKNH